MHPVRSGLFALAKSGDEDAIKQIAPWFLAGPPRERAHQVGAQYGVDSGDLIQDAVYKLIYGRSAAEFDSTDKLTAYVYKMCRNRALRLVRELRRWCQPADGQLEARPRQGPGPEEEAELLDAVLAVRKTLSADHDTAVRLFYFEELSIAEIATALGIPAGTVQTRLHHARKHLRTALEGKL